MNHSIPVWRVTRRLGKVLRCTPLFFVAVIAGCGACNHPTKPPLVAGLTLQEIGDNTELWRQEIEKRIAEGQHSAAVALLGQVDVRSFVEYSVAEQDDRWMAVYEYGLVLPGLDDNVLINAKPNDYWILPDTSDVLDHPQWQVSATEFAAKYNHLLRERRSSDVGN